MNEVEPINVKYEDLPTVKIPLQGIPAGPLGEVLNDTEDLDLQQFLIRKPSDTYFSRISMNGDSMIYAGILPGAIIIYNVAQEPRDGNIVVARIGSELTVKRLVIKGRKMFLVADTFYTYQIEIKKHMDFEIMGVLEKCINSF